MRDLIPSQLPRRVGIQRPIGLPEKCQSNRKDAFPILYVVPSDVACGPKVLAFQRGYWNHWFAKCGRPVSEPMLCFLRNRPCWRINEWFGGWNL